MFPGLVKTLAHDYRNVTTTLLAAIELAEGKIIAECMPPHRHKEWIERLKQIDASASVDLDLHLIVDNYTSDKPPSVLKWLKKHQRFLTPTSNSGLTVIKCWFRDITHNRTRNGAFRSVTELDRAARDHIEHRNANPKSFVWTKNAEDIL